MNNKHTPGPWYKAGMGNHQGLIISENTGENIAVSYDKANAQLIAAAPELLEAARASVAALSQNKTFAVDVKYANKLLKDAIDKAEGA